MENSELSEIGLFKEEFYKDWVVILALVAAGFGAYGAAKNYGNAKDFEASDWLAVTVDAGIAAVINTLLFGFVPALIRRRMLLSKGRGMSRDIYMPSAKIFLLVGALCFAVVIVGVNSKSTESSVGATLDRCMPKGADELCVHAEYLGGEKASMKSTWKYSAVKYIAGYSVSEISWLSKIDCEVQSGFVDYLFAYDSYGGRVDLPSSLISQMIQGIEDNQLSQLVTQVCSAK